ncbi:MAG TPA: ABC transporter ATP-binding protein, partial [Candidatus Limnocylindrales bacterium]|nr:ABC transporter ATP-binding protein [Candidatus Limnocylindrales bacterium]
MTEIPPVLEMRGITKRFPGTLANDRIDLDVRPGEIHALLGENGAGKTTLMNILYGLVNPDAGEVLIDGRSVTIREPADAIARGIGMVHQHFMLVPVLTVAENVILGAETTGPPGILDLAEAERRIRALAEQLGFEIEPRARIDTLSVGQQQRVEILKALYRGARILVLDEPTAVLTPQETAEIFAVLRRLRAEGTSIIFISHKLDEVLAIADRITVIRRGRVVGSRRPAETSEQELAELMVGREVSLVVDRGISHPGAPVLRIEGLRVLDDRGNERVRGIDLEVRSGEVLGIAGVAGNGQDELVEALVGLRRPTAGRILLDGQDVAGVSTRRIRAIGVAYVPADRQRYGLVLPYPVEDNLVLTAYHVEPYARRGFLRNDRAIEALAAELIPRYDIRTPSPKTRVATLSGGNQQKVVVAREFSGDVRLLVL